MYYINFFINYLYNDKYNNWLLHCDVDEYIKFKNNNIHFIKEIINDNPKCNKIFIPWLIYGTSYLNDLDENKSIQSQLIMHENNYSKIYKCIFKPEIIKTKIANNPHFINIHPEDNIYIIGYNNKLFTSNELKSHVYNNFYHFKYNFWSNFKYNDLPVHFNHYQLLSARIFIKRKIYRMRCAEMNWGEKKNTWYENNKCIKYLYNYKFNESHDHENDFLPILKYNKNRNTFFEMICYNNYDNKYKMTIKKYNNLINSKSLKYWNYNDLKNFLIKK